MKSGRNKKLVVAMSGGVDSSVAAALLKKQGYFVIGVFMKFWQPPQSGGTRIDADSNADLRRYENRCCSTESEKLARLVAQKIGIPFYVINVEKEFKKRVVDYFLKEYKKGNTPNPCVVCNKEVKFGLLIEKALKMGADFIATGHYARTSLAKSNFFCGESLSAGHPRLKKIYLARSVKLLKAKDRNKDQSYFLWQLNQKQLSRILFPVGNYTKIEVRKLAKKFNLPTAEIPESQEVCFIPGTANDFLKKYLKTKFGKIVDKSRRVLGEHQGLWFYTIGQRRGIGLSGGPYYVIAKDFKKNILVVSNDKKDLLRKELVVKNVKWICPSKPYEAKPWRVKAKIRYKTKEARAVINRIKSKKYKLQFIYPQKAITPGQSVVFYKAQQVLGGGVIE